MKLGKTSKKTLKLFSIAIGSTALFMLYKHGGWHLTIAIFLFGWSLNLDRMVEES